jgi:hypothetical protein
MPKNDFWDDEPDDESTGPASWKIWSIVDDDETYVENVTMAEADAEWRRQHKRGNTQARYKRSPRQ